MWLTVKEISKRTGVHEKTIKRRAKKFKWPMQYVHNPQGGPILTIDFSLDTVRENLQKKFNPVRTVRTKSDSSLDSLDTQKKSSLDTSESKKSSLDSLDSPDNKKDKPLPENEDICKQCKSAHPSCDGCCRTCEDKCNSEQRCKLNLTGQEIKPELSHKGTDSSPVPAPFSGLQLQHQAKDNIFYTNYRTKPEPEVPDSYKRVGQLKAQLCIYVLDLIKTGMKKAEAYDRTVSLYNFGSIVNELKEDKSHKTISTKTLYRWVKIYKEGGSDYMDLIPNYAVGPGSIKITPYERDYLLHNYFTNNKPSIGSVIKNLKTEILQGDEQSPSSETTLRRWLLRYIKNNKRLDALARKGDKYLRDHLIKYIERDSEKLIMGDVFIADGNVLNFLIIDRQTGKPKRMVFVPVMDWASRMIVGANIAATEDTQNITNAYRTAMINYGGVPRVMYLDNGRAFKGKFFIGMKESDRPDLENLLGGLFKRLGIQEFFAKAYNARSKVIERWFKTFNDQFEKFLGSYTGVSLQSILDYTYN